MATAIQEIVCPSPEAFEARPTSVIAAELDALSRDLVEGGHPVRDARRPQPGFALLP
jgi:hypothetical protein